MKALLEQLNFTIDKDHLTKYYETVVKEFQDYKWTYQQNKDQVKDIFLKEYVGKSTNTTAGYGWAITTNNLDPESKTNIPWQNIHKDFQHDIKELAPERNTPLVFGIIETIKQKIPYAQLISLSVFPPGTELVPHKDEPFLLRVHIPILCDKKSFWLNEEGYQTLDVGQAYLCDTRQPHSVYNDGGTDRVHLLFAIHQDHESDIKSITGTL